MRSWRAAAVAALALAAPLVLAPPAHAAGAVLSPGAGAVFAQDTAITVEARVEGGSTATQLQLVDPTGDARTVASSSPRLTDQTLQHVFETACPAYPGSACAGRRPAVNGTWTVRLTGGAADARSVVLRIPPRAPSGVRAEATGPREVVVTWQRGAEPDLLGHAVVDGEGRRLTTDSTCADGTCRAVVAYDADGPRQEALAVQARRATCPGCAEALTATSAAVQVDRPGPPPAPDPAAGATPPASGDQADPGTPAEPGPGGAGAPASPGTDGAPTPSTGTPDTSGGPDSPGAPGTPDSSDGSDRPPTSAQGGTGTSGAPSLGDASPQAAADQFALTFRAFGPKTGLPKLPPLPATGVALPAVAPPEDGQFEQALPFGDQVAREPASADGPVAAVGQAVSSAVDSERFARSLAAALVLLLAGAHLRRWLAQGPVEP